MSADKSRNFKIISDGVMSILPHHMKSRESPQEYVNRIMDQSGMTHGKVAMRAQKLGYKLSHGYVHNIARGTVDNPSLALIQALAAGLGRPEDEVIDVFRGKQLQDEAGFKSSWFARLWGEYKELSDADQKDMRIVLEMLQREIQRRLENINN